VWLLTAIHFCGLSSNATIGFWVPSIIQGLGVTDTLTIGMLSAVPYIAAVIAMVLVSRHSDRTLERRYHAALPCLACAAGLVGIGVFATIPVLAFAALVVAVASALCYNGAFWQCRRCCWRALRPRAASRSSTPSATCPVGSPLDCWLA